MKTLFLLRHASATADTPTGRDHDRALNATGALEAAQVGKRFEGPLPEPTLILCSSAERALKTLSHLSPTLRADAELRIEKDLYLASPECLYRIVSEASDSHETLLVVAHEPGISEFANELVAGGDPAAKARMSRGFPPAALAQLEIRSECWTQLRSGSAHLVDFVSPLIG